MYIQFGHNLCLFGLFVCLLCINSKIQFGYKRLNSNTKVRTKISQCVISKYFIFTALRYFVDLILWKFCVCISKRILDIYRRVTYILFQISDLRCTWVPKEVMKELKTKLIKGQHEKTFLTTVL